MSIRREVRTVAELLAATGFAITQPILSVFGRSADVFINRDASAQDIVLFALAIAVVPTVLLWVLELIVGFASDRARSVLHVVIVSGLAAVFGLHAIKGIFGIEGAPVALGALALGVLVAFVYVRVAIARVWLGFAGFAPLVFVGLFLVSSSVSSLVFTQDVEAADLGTGEGAPPVVMVAFDEWPTSSFLDASGAVDAEHFPNLARLAGSSTWYRNSTSVTTSTWYAVPTLLTGRYPKDGDVPEASSHPESLFTLLGGSHRVRASETVTRLCPSSFCEAPKAVGPSGLGSLLASAVSTYRQMLSPERATDDLTAGFEERTTERVVAEAAEADDHGNLDLGAATANRPERFEAFLDGLHRDAVPTLDYVHILLPHVAYRYLPDGRHYPSPAHEFGKVDDDWSDQAWPPALANERLLLQAAYTDRLIGDLIDALERSGLWDEAIVVVAGDHGIAFDPGQPVRGLSATPVPPSLYPQLLWTPLFIRAPGQESGAVSDANVMTVDVLPTIADLAGIEIPWTVDGVPAGTRPPADTTKTFLKATVNPFGVGLGPRQEFDGRPGFGEVLARNLDELTVDDDPELQLFRIRPEGELVGREVRGLTGAPSTRTARLQQLDDYRDVDLRSGTVPSLVWGSLDAPATVAVAVNGVVAGVSPTFADQRVPNRFAAMVPDRLLRQGRNRIELFEVIGVGEGVQLRPVPAGPP